MSASNRIDDDSPLKSTSASSDLPARHNNYNFPFQIQPGHIFFGTAVPLCVGAYLGFARQMNVYKKEAAAEAAAEALNTTVTNVVTTEGKIMAARALTIASMSSVGGFALLGAGTLMNAPEHPLYQYYTATTGSFLAVFTTKPHFWF
jgi:hypothetical protein